MDVRAFSMMEMITILDATAAGKRLRLAEINTAFRWAKALVDAGLDIEMVDGQEPRVHNRTDFSAVDPAYDPDHWVLRDKLTQALAGVEGGTEGSNVHRISNYSDDRPKSVPNGEAR